MNISTSIFKMEIDNYIDQYKKKKCKNDISQLISTSYDYEKIELIIGLFIFFVITELATRTKTIWAYRSNEITLDGFIDGKLWVLRNWDFDSIKSSFNSFITQTVNFQK